MRRKKTDIAKVHSAKHFHTTDKVKIIARVDNAVHAHTADNVFADLGLDDADQLLTRAKLGHAVRMILKKKGLKQRTIAHLLKIDQAEVSKLMNGKYHLFSEGRLFGFLNRLDRKVTVQISPRKKDDIPQEVVFA
jgi:predicted XRE-type DNA-binding protein